MKAIDDERGRSLALFLVLTAIILALRWPFAWTGNEEDYFLLGHRLVEPSAYGPLDAAFDSSRGKWLGLLTLGWPVKLFGFEAAHNLFGVITIAVTAAGLAGVARMLRLGLLPTIGILFAFIALRQSIVGKEWFIGGIETKALAYGFGLIALPAAHDGRPKTAALLVALSAYFHFLVGGFWLLAVLIFQAVDPERRAAVRVFAPVVAVLLLPLLGALLLDLRDAADVRPPAGMPSDDVIYSIIRAPHHVAPFDGPKTWGGRAFASGILGLLVAIAAWLVARRADGALKPFLRTLAILSLLLPIAFIGSWLDRHHGTLGKFYLFRPASPLLLLMLFAAAACIERWVRDSRLRLGWIAIAIASLGCIIAMPRLLRWPSQDSDPTRLIAAVRAHTAPGQMVLIDPDIDERGTTRPDVDVSGTGSLPRKLDRPMFVSWKFVPTNPADIYKWFGRLEQRRRLFTAGCRNDPRIGALIVAPQNLERESRCGTLIYRDPRLAVIATRPS